MKADPKVERLERKVDVISKALDLMLFEEPECLTAEEERELKQAMEDYLKGRRDKFVALDEL